MSIPGSLLARRLIKDTVEYDIGCWEYTEANAAKVMTQWVKLRDTLHVMESEANFLLRCRIRYAITFYEGLINSQVATEVLETLMGHFIDLTGFEPGEVDTILLDRMQNDLVIRKNM